MKTVKLSLKDYDSAPQELLDQIGSNRIQSEISFNWGTMRCRRLLDELAADTRGNTRQGFPSTVAEALIELTLLHDLKMQDLGYGDFTDSEFTMQPGRWKLPKNF